MDCHRNISLLKTQQTHKSRLKPSPNAERNAAIILEGFSIWLLQKCMYYRSPKGANLSKVLKKIDIVLCDEILEFVKES